MGALGIPSAADIERLTRRLRSVSQRLEGIEDAVDRLDERIAVRRRGPRGSGPDRAARKAERGSTRSPAISPRCARPSRPADEPPPRAQERLTRLRAAPTSLSAQPLERRPGRLAEREPAASICSGPRAASAADQVGHREQAGRPHPVAARPPAHRGGLHLDDGRAVVQPRAPADPRAGRRRGRSRRTVTGARPAARASAAASAASACTRPSAPSARLAPSPASAALDREQLAELDVDRAPRTSRSAPASARRARSAPRRRSPRSAPPMPVAWNGQQLAVGAPARVAPEPAAWLKIFGFSSVPGRPPARGADRPAAGRARRGPRGDAGGSGTAGHALRRYGRLRRPWPRAPTTPAVPDAVREAVERTVQATRRRRAGHARRARRRRSTRSSRARRRRRARPCASASRRAALEEARPATHDDIKALQKELRAIGRRLDAIEERLPAKKRAEPQRRASPRRKANAAPRRPQPRRRRRRLGRGGGRAPHPDHRHRELPRERSSPAGWRPTLTSSTSPASTPGRRGLQLQRTEYIEADIRSPVIKLLPQTEVDTVVHNQIVRQPGAAHSARGRCTTST